MKLPVDIPALLSAAIDIEKARAIPVSVNILVDESASGAFQVFVRAGFNSESPNSRVMVSYFPTQTPDPTIPCDLAVIAAPRPQQPLCGTRLRTQLPEPRSGRTYPHYLY